MEEQQKPQGTRRCGPVTALREERLAANRAARLAIQRILESEDATPDQLLEAAQVLISLGKR